MIHQHYDPQQILWFLRNYWKYTRDGMIEQWHRFFQDTNFGKSQYQWLKSRYGMKAEWGAALNHPPYAGARPGGPGTETYEAPELPPNPPRVTFQTRSDSPAPSLIPAPAGSAAPGPATHAPLSHATPARHPSAGPAGPVGNTAFGSGLDQPTAHGPGTYILGGSTKTHERTAAATRSVSGPSMNGTYYFGLGSPFMPATSGGMGALNAMNPILSSLPMTTSSSMPNMPTMSGQMNSFALPHGYPGTQSAMSPHEAAPRTIPPFPYAGLPHPSFPNYGGDFSSPSTAKGLYPADNGLAGLGISHGGSSDHGTPLFPTMSSGFAPELPSYLHGTMPMAVPMNMPTAPPSGRPPSEAAGGRAPATAPTNAEIIANVMRGSRYARAMLDAAVAPRESLGPEEAGTKRKRSVVEVEFQAPKRAMLAASLDVAESPNQVLVAAFPAPEPAATKAAATKPGAKMAATPHTGVSPSVPATPVSVSSASSEEGSPGLVEAEGEWHDGAHGTCLLDGRHRHDRSGGLYFMGKEAFEKAAASHTSGATNTPAGPASTDLSTPTASHSSVPATAAEVPADVSSGSVENGSNDGFDLVTAVMESFLETTTAPLPTQPSVMAAAAGPRQAQDDQRGNLDGAASDLSNVEYLLKTHVGEFVQDATTAAAEKNAAPAVAGGAGADAATIEDADEFSDLVDFNYKNFDYKAAFGMGDPVRSMANLG